jgi:lysophospholipase L1-like esterase
MEFHAGAKKVLAPADRALPSVFGRADRVHIGVRGRPVYLHAVLGCSPEDGIVHFTHYLGLTLKKFVVSLKYWIGLLAVNIFITLMLLVIVEGLASYYLLFRDMRPAPLAERRHTQYDPELGWVNLGNVHIPDMYGPGVYLNINRQGFRNNHEFNPAPAQGKYRIICSGDSFTLGYGVDNDHTWCQRLASLDDRLETVNMGQGGYGIDQAYLWFKRDGVKLAHQMHILAFITEDFRRMQSARFEGYGKPVIEIENGRLVVKNVPVPKLGYISVGLTTNLIKFQELRTIEFINRALVKFRLLSTPSQRDADGKTREIASKLFEDLTRLNERQSSKLVLVRLPTRYELSGLRSEWTTFLEQVSQRLNVPFINILDEARSLWSQDGADYFLRDGHLNEKGNEFVARQIYESLKKQIPLSQRSLIEKRT